MPFDVQFGKDGAVPSEDELKALLVAAGGPWGALIAGAITLFEWLFGGGHAGSCGAFRDAFFNMKAKYDPIFDQTDRLWFVETGNFNPIPTLTLATMSDAMAALINSEDAGFDMYKGENLLGQTMFASRTHWYLYRRWIGAAIFGIAQWTEYRVQDIYTGLTNVTNRLVNYDTAIRNLSSSINSLTAQVADLPSLRSSLAQANANIGVILNTHIPFIYANLKNLWDNVNYTAQVALPTLGTRLIKLEQFVSGNITPAITALQNQQLVFTNEFTDIYTIRLPGLSANLNWLNTIYATVTLPNLQALRAFQYQITQSWQQVVLPGLQTLIQGQQRLTTQLQSQIVPQLQALQQEADQTRNTVVQQILPKIAQEQQDITNLQVLEIPKIWQGITDIQRTLDQVDQPLPVQPTFRDIYQHITQIERQKVQTILPAIQGLQSMVNSILTLFNTYVVPQLNLAYQQMYIVLYIYFPNVFTQLTTINNFMLNITTTIQLTVVNMGPTIYNILKQYRTQNPQTNCDEGRQWWGIWTECWLENHSDTTGIQDVYSHMDSAFTAVPTGPYAQGVQVALTMFDRAFSDDWTPLVVVPDYTGPTYIFADVSSM
jgi:hypothetical protein